MLGLEPGHAVAALLVVVVLVALIYLAGTGPDGFLTTRRRRPSFRPFRPKVVADWRPQSRPTPGPDLHQVSQQLNAVMVGSFQKRRVLNRSEYRVFRVVEDVVAAHDGYRVFAQTCLGEVLQSTDQSAFFSINAKRVDMLVVDGGGWPTLAIEYQGEGHYQGVAAARDAIKKEALRKAGVRYLEVFPADGDEQIRSRVCEHLGWNAS